MEEGINYKDDLLDPKKILEYLSKQEILTLSEFSQAFHFFLNQSKKEDLTIDEKCLMATYLYYVDIDMPPGKNHSCVGKRNTLYQYYLINHSDCSSETIEKISKYYKKTYEKKIKAENMRDEKYMETLNPEVYQQIVAHRENKEKQKTKTRKHG